MKKFTISVFVLGMCIAAQAQVGVNTTNPQAILHVDGAKDNAATGAPDATQAANDMVVTSDGRVGIGTASPNTKLEVSGDAIPGELRLSGRSNASALFGQVNVGNIYAHNLGTNFTGVRIKMDASDIDGVLMFQTASGGTLAERMRINHNGTVGIGTNTPKAKLDVQGYVKLGSTDANADAGTAANLQGAIRYTATNGLQYHDDTNWVSVAGITAVDTTVDDWITSGTNTTTISNVGINITSPTAKLHVARTAPTGTIASTGTAVTGTGTNFTAAFSVGDQIIVNGVSKTIASITDNLNLTLASAFTTDLAAGTAYNSVNAIFNGGNVGIGTTTPSALLDVQSGATSSNINLSRNLGIAPGSEFGSLNFNWTSFYNPGLKAKIAAIADSSGNWGPGGGNRTNISFSTNDNTNTFAERMIIKYDGNVGIGTTTPTAKLDVAGAVKIGTTTTTCSATSAGTIRWNGTNFQGCDGTSWKTLQLN